MKIFIDTANVKDIKEANDLGVVDGVTTNPTLIAKEGKSFETIIKQIVSIVDGPISAEVTSTDSDGIVKEGVKLSKIHKNIVVKVPFDEEGLKAVKKLYSRGVKTNMTLIFSLNQALLAAKVGATYISPFVGRLDDISSEGMDLVQDIVNIFKNYSFKTEVIVASVRSPMHVSKAALMGAHVATVPLKVIKQMTKHPLTDIGIKKFLEDSKKTKK